MPVHSSLTKLKSQSSLLTMTASATKSSTEHRGVSRKLFPLKKSAWPPCNGPGVAPLKSFGLTRLNGRAHRRCLKKWHPNQRICAQFVTRAGQQAIQRASCSRTAML
uniref:Uncharacterized protein n=1 Tax=Cacopsylla melanoneura TaxID=428564 RepID=A0A8D8YAD5_9HEMI